VDIWLRSERGYEHWRGRHLFALRSQRGVKRAKAIHFKWYGQLCRVLDRHRLGTRDREDNVSDGQVFACMNEETVVPRHYRGKV